MSVFGYGNSYPVRQGEDGMLPQPNPQTNAGFGGQMQRQPVSPVNVTSGLPDINFNPNANSPWENPGVEGYTGSGNVPQDAVRDKNWQNPVFNNFGDWLPIENGGRTTARGFAPTPTGVNEWRQRNISSNEQRPIHFLGDPFRGTQTENGAFGPDNPNVPQYAVGIDDLTRQIHGMSSEQLSALDYRNDYTGRFRNAAQDFSNAFANEDYKKSVAGILGENITQESTANWLESAYDDLVKRLNDAWLL